MEIERYEHKHLEIICELNESAAVSRAAEWADVKERALGTERIPGGVRIWLAAQSAELARDLARREAQCCGFLDIEIIMQDNRLWMDITSEVSVDVPLIDFMGSLPVGFACDRDEVRLHGQECCSWRVAVRAAASSVGERCAQP